MEHRTLLSVVEQRHGGDKTRWNKDTVEHRADPIHTIYRESVCIGKGLCALFLVGDRPLAAEEGSYYRYIIGSHYIPAALIGSH